MIAALLGLWGRLQGWLLMLAAALLVLAGAYVAGGRAARKSAELDQARRAANERRKANVVADKIASMDDRAINHAAGRWVRDHDE